MAKKDVKRKLRPKKPKPVIPLGGNVKSKTVEERAADQGVKRLPMKIARSQSWEAP